MMRDATRNRRSYRPFGASGVRLDIPSLGLPPEATSCRRLRGYSLRPNSYSSPFAPAMGICAPPTRPSVVRGRKRGSTSRLKPTFCLL